MDFLTWLQELGKLWSEVGAAGFLLVIVAALGILFALVQWDYKRGQNRIELRRAEQQLALDERDREQRLKLEADQRTHMTRIEQEDREQRLLLERQDRERRYALELQERERRLAIEREDRDRVNTREDKLLQTVATFHTAFETLQRRQDELLGPLKESIDQNTAALRQVLEILNNSNEGGKRGGGLPQQGRLRPKGREVRPQSAAPAA